MTYKIFKHLGISTIVAVSAAMLTAGGCRSVTEDGSGPPPGELLESGNPGDRIRVLNKASGKEVYATVVDANTVNVSF